MSKNIRATQLYPTLVPPTGDLEHILRDQDLSFRTVLNHEHPGRVGSIDSELIHTLDQATISLDRKGLLPSSTLRAQLAPTAVNTDVESLPQTRNHIRKIVAEDVAL